MAPSLPLARQARVMPAYMNGTGASWNQKGADISRPDGILFGYQLDLSDSGDRLIVFARDRVTAYDWNGSSWEQTGQQFKLSSAGVGDMQVSQDGNTVALGGDDPVDWGGAGEGG